jgi:hypothetical protein
MESGAGDATGFQERRNPVPGRDDDQRYDDGDLYRPKAGRVPEELPTCRRRNGQKNKTQNLMPKRVDRLHRCRENVLDELPGRARQLLLRHDFILSKSGLVTADTRLYNQGNICSETAREPMALQLHQRSEGFAQTG